MTTRSLNTPHTQNQHDAKAKSASNSTGVGPALESSSLSGGTIERARRQPNALSSGDVLTLQRTMGNRAVSHLLQRQNQTPPAVPVTSERAEPRAKSAPVIQRKISKKQDRFGEVWERLRGPTQSARTDKQTAEGYLSGFETKATDKEERKAQKKEQSRTKKLLSYKGKETTSTTSEDRVQIRAALGAERARGYSFEVLEEFKAFLTDNFANINENRLLIGYFGGYPAKVALLDRLAGEWGASDEMREIIYSRAYLSLDAVRKDLPLLAEAVRALAPRAEKVATTVQGEEFTHLGDLARQALELAEATVNALAEEDSRKAIQGFDTLKGLQEQVAHLTLLGENRNKINYRNESETGESKQLSGGMVSKVMEVHYDPKLGRNPNNPLKINHGVFKQDQFSYVPGKAFGAHATGVAQYDPNFSGRAIGSYKVDKLLGLGVTARTKRAMHDGMSGTVMEWAEGQSPMKNVSKTETPDNRFVDNLDLSDPELQRHLATLQLLDIITGQMDRHLGNYFISQGPNGTKITAIDSDFAFGAKKGIDRVKDINNKPRDQDQTRGLPLFVDQDVAQRILSTTPEQLTEAIGGLRFTEAEVNKTLERFAIVKDHLRKLITNTERIRAMEQRIKDAQKQGNVTMATYWGQQLDRLYGKGAVLGKHEWSERTARYQHEGNSYYGRLVSDIEEARKDGKMLPKQNQEESPEDLNAGGLEVPVSEDQDRQFQLI